MTDLKQACLIRFAYTEMGTFGRLWLDHFMLCTVERPWVGNQLFLSCIPEGTYQCRPRRYYRGGYDAIEVCDVPGRTHILFHKGNVATDVAGCIAVGGSFGAIGGLWAVQNSWDAFEALMGWADGEDFRLKVWFRSGYEEGLETMAE